VGFFQFLRNFCQCNAFEQAELILQAALDPTIASRAKKGEFVTWVAQHLGINRTTLYLYVNGDGAPKARGQALLTPRA
jgi:hypothetical protein